MIASTGTTSSPAAVAMRCPTLQLGEEPSSREPVSTKPTLPTLTSTEVNRRGRSRFLVADVDVFRRQRHEVRELRTHRSMDRGSLAEPQGDDHEDERDEDECRSILRGQEAPPTCLPRRWFSVAAAKEPAKR